MKISLILVFTSKYINFYKILTSNNRFFTTIVMKLNIVFDQPNKVYHPGEKVSGKIQLIVSSVARIKRIKLKCIGKAECKWIKPLIPGTHEIYFEREQTLLGDINEYHILPAGEHSYPFTVQLPTKVPSSFNGSFGAVTYYSEVKIETPGLNFNKIEKSQFTVANLFNLNFYSFLRTPSRSEENKIFRSLHRSAGGSLKIVANLPKNGYIPSESIPITLEVNNDSDIEIHAIYVYFIRIIEWKVGGKYTIKKESKKLQKTRFNGVPRRQSLTFDENLTIPSITFPSLTWCSIIEIYHKLRIKADTSGIHSGLDMQIPITIGDIPFSENSSDVDLVSQAKNKVGIEKSLEKISKNPLFPVLSYSKVRSNSTDPSNEAGPSRSSRFSASSI